MINIVDLDGTLCVEKEWDHAATYEEYAKSFAEAEPIIENIKKIRALHAKGEIIIIWTSRFHEDLHVTTEWLNKHGVPYSDLYMGKPRGDRYIDSIAVRPEELEP